MSELGPLADPTEQSPIPMRDLRDAIRLDHGKPPLRSSDPEAHWKHRTPVPLPAKRRVKSSYTVPIVLILIGTAMNIWIGVAGAMAFAIWVACTR